MKNVILIFTVIVLAFASCSLVGSGDGAADITLSFGSEASRALETGWTGGAFPALSSITVTVSADDMRTVTKTVPGDQRRISVRVPFGKDRLVEVTAVPVSPGVAESYSGSGLTDVGYRATASLRIAVELSGSALLLPDVALGNLYEAKLSSGGLTPSVMNSVVTSVNSDFEFDDHGRIYIGTNSGIQRVTALSGGTVEQVFTTTALAAKGGIAYDSSSHRVFFVNSPLTGGPATLHFADITLAIPQDVTVALPGGFATLGNAIAANDGSVFVVSESATAPRIVKLSVGAASGTTATATQSASVAFADAGLAVTPYQLSNTVDDTKSFMNIEDMLAREGVLYIVASEENYYPNISCTNNYAYSKGKMIAVNALDMVKQWEAGWAGDANHYPIDPATQFYAPRRIVGIMPKKIYVADDGQTYKYRQEYIYDFFNVDRVMEVETDAHTVAKTDLDIGTIGFFHDFDTLTGC